MFFPKFIHSEIWKKICIKWKACFSLFCFSYCTKIVMSDQPCDVLFNKNKEQKKLAISFWWNILGIFCCWSSYLSVFNLQSSINVEEGLGMIFHVFAKFTTQVIKSTWLSHSFEHINDHVFGWILCCVIVNCKRKVVSRIIQGCQVSEFFLPVGNYLATKLTHCLEKYGIGNTPALNG